MSVRRLVLVYHPDEADAYARLIRLPRRGLEVAVCSTPAEAAARIADAEILYAWGFPPDLLARAPRLRWIQGMGAGVERFFVPGLPATVVVTRAAGINLTADGRRTVIEGGQLLLDTTSHQIALKVGGAETPASLLMAARKQRNFNHLYVNGTAGLELAGLREYKILSTP